MSGMCLLGFAVENPLCRVIFASEVSCLSVCLCRSVVSNSNWFENVFLDGWRPTTSQIAK